jgi:ABC-type multidrug transport system ATPase subunit
LDLVTNVPKERKIASVSSVLMNLLCIFNPSPKEELHILSNLTGRILPRKMTLLIGPPGSGKSGNFYHIHFQTFCIEWPDRFFVI